MWEFFTKLTNPESIIQYGGLWLLLFVLFAETGLLIGFFLPGDSLVFISGLICATNPQLLNVDIIALMSLMCLAAILGNMFGYYFGYKAGEKLYSKKDSLIFKQSHLQTTKAYYDKYGGRTIILGRFLPIIRTFAPILAGVIKIDFKKFMIYNIVGALAWINSIGLIGYFLGKEFPGIKNYLGYIVIGLIVITTAPVAVTYFKNRKKTE
jgi:membrane-associated protein